MSAHKRKEPKNVYRRLHNEHSYTGMYADRLVAGSQVPNYAQDNSALFRPTMHPGRSSLDSLAARRSSTHALTIAEAQSKRELSHQPMQDPASKIEYLFERYCRHGRSAQQSRDELSSGNFMKFVRDTPKLIGQNFKAADVDIIFAKAKPMHDRGLKMNSFLDALSAIASKKFPKHGRRKAFTYLLAQYIFRNKTLTRVVPSQSPPLSNRKPQEEVQTAPDNPRSDDIVGTEVEGKYPEPDVDEGVGAAPVVQSTETLVPFPEQVPPVAIEAARRSTQSLSPDVHEIDAKTNEKIADDADDSGSASARAYVGASRLGYNNSVGMGFRVGNPDAAITVGAFLDLTCSNSKKLFLTLLTKVLLQTEQSHKGQVAVVIHPFLTPWRASSLIVNEVAIAVRQASPEAYLAFCTSVLERQASFSEAKLYGESRKVVHDRLLELVSMSGGNVNAVRDSIQVHGPGGNPLWRTVQLDALFAIQNGIRSCPTVTINGLVDYFPTNTWDETHWLSYLTKLL